MVTFLNHMILILLTSNLLPVWFQSTIYDLKNKAYLTIMKMKQTAQSTSILLSRQVDTGQSYSRTFKICSLSKCQGHIRWYNSKILINTSAIKQTR